jgi:alkylation response protein AidB-like acyl-CoA dehydrogenase
VAVELSDTRAALRHAVERLLADRCSPARVRDVEAGAGFDHELWDAMVTIGLPAMSAAPPWGSGASLVDALLVCETVGRALAPVPLPQTMVGARVLATLSHDQAADAASGVPMAIVPDADAPAPFVSEAGLVLVAGSGGWRLHESSGGPGVRLTSGEPAATARDLGPGEQLAAEVEPVLDELRVLEAARLVGLGVRALEVAVAYCKEREQFGRRIGTFQALQHRLADHATAVDAARLLVLAVGEAFDAGRASTADARAAYRWCAAMARDVTADGVQVHGGYGFTLEYDPQLYLRRARAWGSWIGDEVDDWSVVGRARLRAPIEPVDPGLPPEAVRFRGEVREFLREHLGAEVLARMRSTGTFHDAGFHRALAEHEWVGMAWPRADGTSARTPFETAVFADEAGYAHAPVDGLQTSNIVAQVLLRVGTEEQRARFVEPIRRGELLVCLGFTEPEAGSDVAAARTRAVRDGDEWVITGSKMFTTLAHVSDYVFLLTRTDPDVAKHEGLTVFLVPLDAAGVEIRPVETLGGERTNVTFYDGVRVPDSYRVGEVDGGWAVMAVSLDVERAGADYAAQARRVLDETVRAVSARAIDDPLLRERLARLTEAVRSAELSAWRVVRLVAEGRPINVEASMAKLLGAVVFQRVCEECLDALGPRGLVVADDDEDPAGWVEAAWRHSKVTSIYGGTSEVQRNIIAQRGLGLPRA